MKSAVELFALELPATRSSMIEMVWRTRRVPEESFISVAESHWEMVVARQPETKATTSSIPQDAEFFGIQFSLGTFLPGLPPGRRSTAR